MKQHIFLHFLLILSVCLLCGCSSGKLFIERSPDKEPPTVQKMISIQPDYFKARKSRSAEQLISRAEADLVLFEEALIEAASRADWDLQVYSPTRLKATDLDYFNDLLPLKNYLLMANQLQDVETTRESNGPFKPAYAVLDDPVAIPSDFSWMAEKYGTPYFAIHGMANTQSLRLNALWWMVIFPPAAFMILVPKQESLYYNVVVDVVQSQVVYRELRVVKKRPSRNNMEIMCYDSFRLFQEQ